MTPRDHEGPPTDVDMTGLPPNLQALEVYELLATLPNLHDTIAHLFTSMFSACSHSSTLSLPSSASCICITRCVCIGGRCRCWRPMGIST